MKRSDDAIFWFFDAEIDSRENKAPSLEICKEIVGAAVSREQDDVVVEVTPEARY